MSAAIGGLSAALAISVGRRPIEDIAHLGLQPSSAALGWACLDARGDLVVAVRDRDAARELASACSDATEDLRVLADKRAEEARRAQVAARRQAAAREQLAQLILSTPAALTGDDCGSARIRVDRWLAEREDAR